MTALTRWRVRQGRGELLDTSRALTFARIGDAQAVLVIAMVLAATATARGMGS